MESHQVRWFAGNNGSFDNDVQIAKEKQNGVAIRVNGELVEDARFYRAFLQLSGGATPEMVQREDPGRMYACQRMVEQAVLEKVILMQAARAEGIRVSLQEIEEERRKAWGTDAYLVCGAGLRADLEEILLRRKMDAHLTRHVPRASQAEVQTAYRQRSQQYAQPARVQAQQIFLSAETAEGRAAGFAAMDRVLQEVRRGKPFPQVPVKLGGAVTYNELGWVKAGDLVPELEDTLFQLRAGQVSEILQTVFGLHVLKAVSRHEARTEPFAEVKQALAKTLWDERRRVVRAEALRGFLQRANIQGVTEAHHNLSGVLA